ncbi:hypothetical protein F1880_001849 [Penicillium rolfsii]|nr:hypothetical protein F1880_001849 [Penicillium rolfsii]
MADMHKDSTKIPLDESSRHGPKFDELEMAQGPFILSQSQHLHGQQYSWVSSIFYFGFLIFEYPLTGFLHSFTASRYLGSFIIMWGLCVVMTNFADSFAGLMVSRFILGALESVMAPSFVAITGNFLHSTKQDLNTDCYLAQWYSREAQPLRQVIWFSGTPLFGIFGGLLSYALGHAHTVVTSWRLLYIIFGSVTVIWGIIFTLLFPSSPQKASFLSEEERAFVMLTSQQQHSTFDAKWKWSQVREALLDVKSYIFFLIGVANTIPSGALSNVGSSSPTLGIHGNADLSQFSSLLIKGFGFTALQTQLLGIPSHAIQLVSLLVRAYEDHCF